MSMLSKKPFSRLSVSSILSNFKLRDRRFRRQTIIRAKEMMSKSSKAPPTTSPMTMPLSFEDEDEDEGGSAGCESASTRSLDSHSLISFTPVWY